MAAMGISRSSGRALVAVALMLAAAVLGTASAATYNVGEPGGAWDLNTNYVNWASSKKFHPGDEIVFKYSAQAHDVVEVNKAAFDSCSASNAIVTHQTGNDVIPLNTTGTRYFICGFPNHCSTTGTGKMKLQIDVVPSSSSSSPPGAPAGGPTAAKSPPPPPSSAATSVTATAAGFGLAVLLAGLMA